MEYFSPMEGKTLRSRLFRAITWMAALGCFYLVFSRIDAAEVGAALALILGQRPIDGVGEIRGERARGR